MYYWQLMGYLCLLRAKKARLRYCLVNGTADLINDEKRRLMYQMRIIDETPEYVEKCKQIERNHIFDMGLFFKQNPHFDFHTKLTEWDGDIPLNERIFTFEVDYSKEEELLIEQKVRKANDYIELNFNR